MKRREFITLIGGAAAWPVAARAQRASMPVIGFFNGSRASSYVDILAAFRRGLGEAGYVEGRNIAIELRWADGNYERLPGFVDELIRRPVAVLCASGIPAALAAKKATTTIPIVFEVAFDPVSGGLVTSFNRPGGNLTGVTMMARALGPKRVELLREFVPTASLIGMLVNPNIPSAATDVKEIEGAAAALGLKLLVLHANSEGEIEPAFRRLVEQRAAALYVSGDPFFATQRELMVLLSARHTIPTMFDRREYAAVGGLMSYGSSFTDAHHQMGVYTGRVLKGEKPGDLPILQPTKFDLVINLKTARALGLTVPDKLLAIADEVIE
jgi:putative ABC transport system substrate-binding protein